MALVILSLIFAVLIFFWLILTMPPQKSAAFLTNSGPIILIVLGALLTFIRRGVIGVPLIIFGLSWWRRNRSIQPSPHSGGRKSTVRSSSLEMELDHDTGEMEGWVLTGRREGARLSSLSETELLSLYQEMYGDADSAALLETFLDRYHSGWRERYEDDTFRKQGGESSFASMTRKEAYQVLGLEPGASQEEIHQAWRRLVKALHPDSGGSEYLTAKINAARDLLLS